MSKNVTKTESDTELLNQLSGFSTTSSKIRFLNQKGFSRGKIAQILNVRYQHVRNVLITPVKNPK